MYIWQIIGSIGVLLTATQLLPQILKSIKSKQTQDLSFGLIGIIFFGAATWVIYGIHITDYPLIIANAINFFCASLLLVLKIKYNGKPITSIRDGSPC